MTEDLKVCPNFLCMYICVNTCVRSLRKVEVRFTTDHYIHADSQVWNLGKFPVETPPGVNEDLDRCSAMGNWVMDSGTALKSKSEVEVLMKSWSLGRIESNREAKSCR